MSGKIMMPNDECIREFCRSMGLRRVTKLVLTVESNKPVKLEVTMLPPEAALNVFLESTYHFELKEVPGSGHTIIKENQRWYDGVK